MSFQLAEQPRDVALELRNLEQSLPAKGTPLAVRAMLIEAAKEIEAWRDVAVTSAEELEHASALRIGQMDSQSKVDEVHRRIKQALVNVALKLRVQIGG